MSIQVGPTRQACIPSIGEASGCDGAVPFVHFSMPHPRDMYSCILRGMAVKVLQRGWGIVVGLHPSSKSTYWVEFDDNVHYISFADIVEFQLSNQADKDFSCLRYGKQKDTFFLQLLTHGDNGKNGNHTRVEFAEGHEYHGEIDFYENGKLVRTEYAKGHEQHGEIRYFENGKHVRTEYDKDHKRHGHICYYENDTHVRTEFVQGHKLHGTICYYENGKFVYTEFAEKHQYHGEIHYYGNGKLARIEFAEKHQCHGEIRYFENGHARSEYANGHQCHGEIRYIENGKHARTEFAKEHENHGKIRYIESDKLMRISKPNQSTLKRKREDLYDTMRKITDLEIIDEKHIQAHVHEAINREFPTVDLCNSTLLERMAKRSKEARQSYKSQMSIAFDKVFQALDEFEAIAKNAKLLENG